VAKAVVVRNVAFNLHPKVGLLDADIYGPNAPTIAGARLGSDYGRQGYSIEDAGTGF